jgi:hypothetical protein
MSDNNIVDFEDYRLSREKHFVIDEFKCCHCGYVWTACFPESAVNLYCPECDLKTSVEGYKHEK